MINTRNPVRRNRNIGTFKLGYGQDNKLVIPSSYYDSMNFWEKLTNYRVIVRIVNDREVKFIIEPTKRNHYYYCTVDDVALLISRLPEKDIEGINLFVFRQPKKKEEILEPVWGRIGFDVDIGTHRGPAIFIDAIDISKTISWSKSLSTEQTIELERLRQDGHRITRSKRGYDVETNPDSVRATQLYRTLIHEVGHWVQWKESVIYTLREGVDSKEFEKRYFNIPKNEREIFAHRYADVIYSRLSNDNIIPFCKIYNRIEIESISMFSDFFI